MIRFKNYLTDFDEICYWGSAVKVIGKF